MFASAEQFLASGAAATADCLILDLGMPGINGLELQRWMRAAGFRIPTIVITAHADDVSRARALAVSGRLGVQLVVLSRRGQRGLSVAPEASRSERRCLAGDRPPCLRSAWATP